MKTEKNNTKILIVDDEENFLTILSSLMKKQGHKVVTAGDGKKALKLIHMEAPDVLLSDVKMPGMDGIELLKKAKELDPDLPVVMITGFADIPGAVNMIKLGAHDYLPKPFDNNEVIRVVQRALTERELKRKLKEISNRLQENMSLAEKMGPVHLQA